MQILLTGFGPFGAVVNNPAARLTEHFAAHSPAGQELTTLLLPVSFARAPQMLEAAIAAGAPGGAGFDVLLMLGVAARSPHWRVERVGRNHHDAVTDADGFTPSAGQIDPRAPDCLKATLPIEPLVEAICAAGLPAAASDSAGGYLCNHLLFSALRLLAQTGSRTRAGFLHVPADDETFGPGAERAAYFTFSQQITAVEAVLRSIPASEAVSGEHSDICAA